jgi:hypothetical protein
MDIDNNEEQQQIMHQNKSIDVASMKDNFQGLAKTIEILQSVYNNVEGDKIKSKITKTFEEIVNMGDYFKFLITIQQHNEEMMKSPDLVKSILGLINAIVTHIFIQYKDQDPKKLKDKQLTTYLITISVFWTFLTKIEKNDSPLVQNKSDKNIPVPSSIS